MTREDFLILYQRFLNGECSQDEMQQLNAYQDNMLLEDNQWEAEAGDEASIREAIRAGLQQSIQNNNRINARRRTLQWRTWRVAAVLAALAIGLYYLATYRHHTLPDAAKLVQRQRPGHPQEKKTYLTLGNGEVISLTDASTGTITEVSGIIANKQQGDRVAYEAGKDAGKGSIPDTNSIRTPYGQRFAITLSDGSRVWLNAASGLRFPVYFTGNEREVYLTGEACFEVKADPLHPFIVHVNDMAVQAVGTVFNIKAYEEEKNTATTLVTGTVHVTMPQKTRVLKPGQQLLYDEDIGRSQLYTPNIATVLAWRDGLFSFDHESIAAIMYEIGRWYNMEIVFERGDLRRSFSATAIQRTESLNEVLKKLELTGAMRFKTNDTKIMVTLP